VTDSLHAACNSFLMPSCWAGLSWAGLAYITHCFVRAFASVTVQTHVHKSVRFRSWRRQSFSSSSSSSFFVRIIQRPPRVAAAAAVKIPRRDVHEHPRDCARSQLASRAVYPLSNLPQVTPTVYVPFSSFPFPSFFPSSLFPLPFYPIFPIYPFSLSFPLFLRNSFFLKNLDKMIGGAL